MTKRATMPTHLLRGPTWSAEGSAGAPNVARTLVADSRAQTLGALLLYVAFAAFLTWPLLTHLDSSIYISPARPEGDYTSIIAQYRELAEGWHNPFLPGRIEDFNAPHGQPILWVNNLANFPSTILLYLMTTVFGATAAFGLFAIAGLVASAIAMFLLVRRYSGSPGIALVIGYAYGFYPYVIANGEHPHHMHGWVFVLMAWRLLRLFEEPTMRNGIWAGLASVVALSWTPYFLLTGGVLLATVTGAALVIAGLRRQITVHLVPQMACIGIVLAYLVMVRALVAIGSDAVALGGSSLFDIFAQTARAANYLVPSGHNPIFGELTKPFLVTRGWFDNAEKSLYVGISLVLLAVTGGIAALRGSLGTTGRARVVIFSAVAVVALVFSAPPRVAVGDHILSLPSYYMWQLEPGWRIYTRFVMVVMLGLCVVAAFGLAALREGRRPAVSAAILAAAAIVIPLDLWSKFEPNTRTLEQPAIYQTLRDQPPGIVAEYPIQPSGFAENYDEMFYQQSHGKPILNGFQPHSEDEAEALSLASLSDPRTAPRLAERGVRYVLLKRREFPYSPRPGRPGAGFELMRRSAFADLYRVTARPEAQLRPG